MQIPGGWKIPAAVTLAFATAVGAYAVVRPEPSTTPPAVESGVGQYPQAEFSLVDGEGKGLVHAYCTACHSLAPIVHHSGFTPSQWASEVTKMREVYAAPIDDTTAAQITKYLQANYAESSDEPAGTSRHVWSDPSD